MPIVPTVGAVLSLPFTRLVLSLPLLGLLGYFHEECQGGVPRCSDMPSFVIDDHRDDVVGAQFGIGNLVEEDLKEFQGVWQGRDQLEGEMLLQYWGAEGAEGLRHEQDLVDLGLKGLRLCEVAAVEICH